MEVQKIIDYILVWAAAGEQLTHKKLQKLLYFCQAWYLGYYGKALFEEDFEAWVHGPVIRKVYETYKSYGSNPITFQSLYLSPEGEDEQESELENKRLELETELGKQKVEFLNDALNFYGRKSAFWLEMRSHQDQVWKNTRKGLQPIDPCQKIMPKEEIKIEYQQKIQAQNNE